MAPVRIAAWGGLYVSCFAALTAWLPPPADPAARLLVAAVLMALPAVAAVPAAAHARRRSLGPERILWSLLAASAALQVANATFFSTAVVVPAAERWMRVAGEGSYHLGYLLALAAAVAARRHGPAASGERGMALEWLAAAVGGCYLLFAFGVLPATAQPGSWFVALTLQQALPALAFVVRAAQARADGLSPALRILAGGYVASALVGTISNARYSAGTHDLYHPSNVDFLIPFVAIVTAAGWSRSPARVEGASAEARARLVGPLAVAAVVAIPASTLAAWVVAGPSMEMAARTQAGLLATALAAALVAARVRSGAARAAAEEPRPEPAESAAGLLALATGVAHELNNPLMALSGWVELAVRESGATPALERVRKAVRAAADGVTRLQQVDLQPPPAPASVEPAGPPAPHRAPRRPALRILVALASFLAVYYAVRSLERGAAPGDLLLALPALAAAGVLAARARRARPQRRALFWWLLALGALLWAVAETLWAVMMLAGRTPLVVPSPVLDLLFIGFLVPLIAAVALRPHARGAPAERRFRLDAALFATGVGSAFVFAVLLPVSVSPPAQLGARMVLGVLCALLAVASTVLWATGRHGGWRCAYGSVAAFAVSYGIGSAIANGLGGSMPPPGGPADLAWIVPFAILAAGATCRGARRPSSVAAVVVGGALPAAMAVVPGAPAGPGWLEPVSLLLATWSAGLCAARLHEQIALDRRARTQRALLEQVEQRRRRLAAVATVAGRTLGDLEARLTEVVEAASEAMYASPGGADALAHAHRARDVVQEIATAFRLTAVHGRAVVDVREWVEHAVQAALDEGLGAEVVLEGLAALPPVVGDRHALSAALVHLLRNAAHASPGGTIRLSGESDGSRVVLRVHDEGPGVPEPIRERIFDPLFTTRPQAVGLGLTLVHFVALQHGGAVVLAPSTRGATFALALPAFERRRARTLEVAGPLAAAAGLAALAATALAAAPPALRAGVSVQLQVVAAAVATAALARAIARQRGPLRTTWALLAAAVVAWAALRVMRSWGGLGEGPPVSGPWEAALITLADVLWVAALLVRPDQRAPGSGRSRLVDALAVLAAFTFAHAALVALPLVHGDASWSPATAIARAAFRAAVAVWAGALAFGAHTPAWRAFYARLSMTILLWAAGHGVAGLARVAEGYRRGDLADLGWILPLPFLAAAAWRGGPRTAAAPADVAVPGRSAGLALVALAVIALLHLLTTGLPGPAALAQARDLLAGAVLLALAVLLAAREWIDARRPAPADPRWPAGVPSPRLLTVIASAAHELGAHLARIDGASALLRAPGAAHVREDAERIQARARAALGIVRNVIAALPRAQGPPPDVVLDAVVEQAAASVRDAALSAGVALRVRALGGTARVAADGAALRHAVSWLIEHAVAGHAATRRPGTVDVDAFERGDRAMIAVSSPAPPGAPGRWMRAASSWVIGDVDEPPSGGAMTLDLVREIVAREGGSLAVEDRTGGGAEYVIRLPLSHPASAGHADRARGRASRG